MAFVAESLCSFISLPGNEPLNCWPPHRFHGASYRSRSKLGLGVSFVAARSSLESGQLTNHVAVNRYATDAQMMCVRVWECASVCVCVNTSFYFRESESV